MLSLNKYRMRGRSLAYLVCLIDGAEGRGEDRLPGNEMGCGLDGGEDLGTEFGVEFVSV
jgi:hypothetical protein